MYFFLKYIVILFYKKLRIKIVVSLLCESGPRTSTIRLMKLITTTVLYLQCCIMQIQHCGYYKS